MKINIKDIKNSAIGAVAICLVLLILGIALGSTREKITQKKTEVTVELGSTMQLHFDATDFFDVDIQKANKFSFDTSKVDLAKVGKYEVTATYNKETFLITVDVVDTTKPEVEMAERVVFTNDIEKANAGITEMIASIKDESEYTAKLIRFEKKDVLSTMDEFAVKKLEESIIDFGTDKEALALGTQEIPTQPGIYRCTLEIADVHKNAAYREVYVILDTTPAIINEVEDQTITVVKEKLSEKPVIDLTLYKGYDEVDGTLTSDQLFIEVLLKDEAEHEWTVAVSYTDRAGNESKSEFFVKVEEEKELSSGNNNQKPESNSGNNNNNSGNNQGNNGNQNKPADKPSGGGSNNNTEYDPRDTNKDGYVSSDEEMRYITPAKQKCIDAGYGVVVEQDGGEWYAVLMKSGEHQINGKDGWTILNEYLKEHDLYAEHLGGCWINSDNEWFWYIAEEITQMPEGTYDEEDDIIMGEIFD